MTPGKPVVLFGTGRLARTIHYFLVHESPYEIAAVTVDREHMKGDETFGLPTFPFETLPETHPPDAYDLFLALGYRRMNRLREERFRQAKEMGYQLISHISPRASTWPNLEIGENCLVLDEVVVHPYVTIGDDTIIWSGSHVGHGTVIGDHCFIASRAAISGWVTVANNCFLGTNCTVRDGLSLAPMSLVGAGVVVTRDTTEGQILAPPEPRILPGRSDRLPRF